MKTIRTRIGVMLLFVCLVFSFSGCMQSEKKESPFEGKDRDERIIMALEKTYPEHTFHVVTPHGEIARNKGVFADESGLEFEVIIDTNSGSHLQVRDYYLYEILERQDFREKATQIAEAAGYTTRYNENNASLTVEIPIKGTEVKEAEESAQVLLDILNCVETPEIFYASTTMSSRKYSYCTDPKFKAVFYKFTIEGEYNIGNLVRFENKDYSVEEVLEYDIVADNFKLAVSMNEYYKNLEGKDGP